jgi:hypothetical protein
MSKASEASRAVLYTQRVLGSLPSNHLVQRIATLGGSTECVRGLRTRYRALRDFDRIMNIRRSAALAKRSGCGNCGEYAAVAFDLLMLTGCPYAIEYAGYTAPGDHAFVIIGRPGSTDPRNPRTWGADVVVCDAWAGKVVPSASYWSDMPSFPHAVHAPEIDVRWSGLGDHPRTRSRSLAA